MIQKVRDFRYRRSEIATKSHTEIDKMFDPATVKMLKIAVPKRGATRLTKADLLLKRVTDNLKHDLEKLTVSQLKLMKKLMNVS